VLFIVGVRSPAWTSSSRTASAEGDRLRRGYQGKDEFDPGAVLVHVMPET